MQFDIYVHTKPDSERRQQFTAEWVDPDGVFRPQPSKEDGQPVGYRRAQVFYMPVSDFLEREQSRGHIVTIHEDPQER